MMARFLIGVFFAILSKQVHASDLISVLKPSVPFCSQADDFNLNNAYWMAIASEITYHSNETQIETQQVLTDYNLKIIKVKTIAKSENDHIATNGEVLLLESNTDLIIAIRGTETDHGKDVLTDLAVKKVNWPGPGKVHLGFLRFYQAIWDQVEPILKSTNGKKIWLTGHSSGGAAATLIYVHLLANEIQWPNVELKDLYTFGAPRVGNKDFANWVDHNLGNHGIYRLRNYNDPITMSPPTSALPFGHYYHVGEMVYFNKDKQMIVGASEKQVGLNWTDISANKLWSGFDDHENGNYINLIIGQGLSGACH